MEFGVWKAKLLAYVTGNGGHERELIIELLVRQIEILKRQLKEGGGKRPRITKKEKITLAKIGKQLGRKTLQGFALIVQPDTILKWHRELVAKKFDSSQSPKRDKEKGPGRPPLDTQVEELVLKLAHEIQPGATTESPVRSRSWATKSAIPP